MIEETAIVVSATGDFMVVEVQQQSACGNCSVKSGCGTQVVSSIFKSRSRQLTFPNNVDAKPGDRVVLGIDESDMLSGSIRLYLWPIVGLIGGGIAGQWLAGTVGVSSELISVAGGLLGMAIMLYLARLGELRQQIEIKVLRRESLLAVKLGE